MSQASPFAAPVVPAQFTPAAPPPPPPPSSRWHGLLHNPVALAAGAGVVLAGAAGAWLLLGSGGGDDPSLGQAPARAAHSAGAGGSASASASASPSADVSGGSVRNPFVGAPSVVAVTPAATVAPSAPAVPTVAPTAAPSGPAPSGSVPTAAPSPVANPTVTVTATRTVTATPSPSPAAVYVYLAGWIAGTQADLRINLLSAQADPGTTVDGVTYVRQNPAGSSGVCATVKLAGAADSTEQTVCPSAVVQLR